MASWLDLFDEVRSLVGRVPQIEAERHVRYAVIELCEFAPVWQYDYTGGVQASLDGVRSIPLIQTTADAEAVMTSFGYDAENTGETGWVSSLPAEWRFSVDDLGASFVAGVSVVRGFRDPIGTVRPSDFFESNNTGMAVFDRNVTGYILLGVHENAPDLTNIMVGASSREQISAFVKMPNPIVVNGVSYKVWRSSRPWALFRGAQSIRVAPIETGASDLVGRFLERAQIPGSVHGIEWLRVDDQLWTKASVKNINLLRTNIYDTGIGGRFLTAERAYAYEPPIGDRGGNVYFAPFVHGVNEVPFEVRLVLKPTVHDATMPDEAAYLLTEYREALVSGAATRLCSMAKERWTNERAAAIHLEKWNNALEAAKSRGEGRRNSVLQRTRYGGIPLIGQINIGTTGTGNLGQRAYY